MRALAAAALLAWIAAVAGCTGGGERAVPAEKLRALVLQPADLPKSFVRFDAGRLGPADISPGPRGNPTRFGREAGWRARYNRPGSPATGGPLVVESVVDSFGDGEGAERDLATYRKVLASEGRLVEAPAIGEDSMAATFVQESAFADVRFYRIVWRQGNVTASLLVQGFEGKLELGDAVALARKQERRIEDALAE